MKTNIFITFLLILSYASISASPQKIVSINMNNVIICPSEMNASNMPTFTEPSCKSTSATDIDPQNKQIWIKAELNIPDDMRDKNQPYAVFLFAKTSSRIYINGQFIGQNGTPNVSEEKEFPGKMDTMFYVPPSLITENPNKLVIQMSSHHGYLNLAQPIHFIGYGNYSSPSQLLQSNFWFKIIPLGALLLGAIFFAVLSISPFNRNSNMLLSSMAFIAAGQLFAETSRVLIGYSYPTHDLRLIIIVCLALIFGLLLLFYIAENFLLKRRLLWIFSSMGLTLVTVMVADSFDLKTAIAVFAPTLSSTLLIGIIAFKTRTQASMRYLGVFSLASLIILLTINNFHDILFFYLFTAVLFYLFIQHALDFSRELNRRQIEEKQIAKLEYKLEQNVQNQKPQKIKITSAGKIELIATNVITHCKAAGDYVEIYLNDNLDSTSRMHLFSGNLKALEALLPSTFLRVHRSYIVNIDVITSLKKAHQLSQSSPVSSSVLLLKNDIEVPVSRRIMPMVRNILK